MITYIHIYFVLQHSDTGDLKSGKSLLKERMVEIILGKCEFKKIYHIFLNSHSQ